MGLDQSQAATAQAWGQPGPSPLYRRWEWAMSWSITRCICRRASRGQKSSTALFWEDWEEGGWGEAEPERQLAPATPDSSSLQRPTLTQSSDHG